jgi:hypothetical protein
MEPMNDKYKEQLADLFISGDEEDEVPELLLNMNDVWGWACADAELVTEDELPRLADLHFRYGWCGVLFWVSEKRGGERSEFHDVNRFIDFVKAEEALRVEVPSSSKRAYVKKTYTLGE